MTFANLHGTGLGLRHEFARELLALPDRPVDFLEITPENWMKAEGLRSEIMEQAAATYPLITHGLNLNVGGPVPVNMDFLDALSAFFKRYNISGYSEHFSFSQDEQGYLYDLLPLPFTEEAVHYISARIRQIQDRLGMQIALENSSYYYVPEQTLNESSFIRAILEEADCLMLLDVNNVYVNSQNHGYDPREFIRSIPSDRIAYLHIAGHWQQSAKRIIDTHGADIIDPVWDLLALTRACHGHKPCVLERDADIPPLSDLLQEVKKINTIQRQEADACQA